MWICDECWIISLVIEMVIEKCTMDVGSTIRRLGPKGTTPGLLDGFLKDKRDAETEQERHIES